MKHIKIDRESLAWAAGIVDGEGSFVQYWKIRKEGTGKSSWEWTFSVGQKDRRMLDRLESVLQLGKVYGPYGPYGVSRLPGSQPHYRFEVIGFEQVQAVLALLWIWLGPVKREQAKLALTRE